MATKLIKLETMEPPPTRVYCPFTGSLVISADDPIEIETRLDKLSPQLRFVLYCGRTGYPAFWAANPEALSEDQRSFQDSAIRLWSTAADVGQDVATWDGSWYSDYLEKVEAIAPNSTLLLEINAFPTANIPENILNDPNVHISWDFSPAHTIAACFMTEHPPERLRFKRIKTMWDEFLPDYAPGQS